MELKDRLKKIRATFQINSQKEFSEILKWPIGRIQDLESGKVKELKASEALILENLFQINGWWTITGVGQMLLGPFTEIDIYETSKKSLAFSILEFRRKHFFGAAYSNSLIKFFTTTSQFISIQREKFPAKAPIDILMESIEGVAFLDIATGDTAFQKMWATETRVKTILSDFFKTLSKMEQTFIVNNPFEIPNIVASSFSNLEKFLWER